MASTSNLGWVDAFSKLASWNLQRAENLKKENEVNQKEAEQQQGMALVSSLMKAYKSTTFKDEEQANQAYTEVMNKLYESGNAHAVGFGLQAIPVMHNQMITNLRANKEKVLGEAKLGSLRSQFGSETFDDSSTEALDELPYSTFENKQRATLDPKGVLSDAEFSDVFEPILKNNRVRTDVRAIANPILKNIDVSSQKFSGSNPKGIVSRYTGFTKNGAWKVQDNTGKELPEESALPLTTDPQFLQQTGVIRSQEHQERIAKHQEDVMNNANYQRNITRKVMFDKIDGSLHSVIVNANFSTPKVTVDGIETNNISGLRQRLDDVESPSNITEINSRVAKENKGIANNYFNEAATKLFGENQKVKEMVSSGDADPKNAKAVVEPIFSAIHTYENEYDQTRRYNAQKLLTDTYGIKVGSDEYNTLRVAQEGNYAADREVEKVNALTSKGVSYDEFQIGSELLWKKHAQEIYDIKTNPEMDDAAKQSAIEEKIKKFSLIDKGWADQADFVHQNKPQWIGLYQAHYKPQTKSNQKTTTNNSHKKDGM